MLRRPWLSAVSAAAVLLVMALPVLHMHTADSGTDAIPRDQPVMKVYDKMQAAFPGGEIPAVVVLKAADVTSPRITAAVTRLEADALATGKVKAPIDTTVSPDRHVLQVGLPIVGSGTDNASNSRAGHAARRRRAEVRGPRRDQGLRDGHDRRVQGLQRPHEVALADRVRLRPEPAPSCCCC